MNRIFATKIGKNFPKPWCKEQNRHRMDIFHDGFLWHYSPPESENWTAHHFPARGWFGPPMAIPGPVPPPRGGRAAEGGGRPQEHRQPHRQVPQPQTAVSSQESSAAFDMRRFRRGVKREFPAKRIPDLPEGGAPSIPKKM